MAVFGLRASGKTTWVQRLLASRRRVLVLDPNDEYGCRRGWSRVEGPDEALAHLLRVKAPDPSRVYRIACLVEGVEDARAYLRIAWTLRRSWVVAEEVPEYASPGWAPPELRRLLRRGRHRGISVVATAQRPAEAPATLRSLADLIVAFRLAHPLDLEAVRPWLGEHAEELPRLGVGQFRYYGLRDVIEAHGIPMGAPGEPLDRIGILV